MARNKPHDEFQYGIKSIRAVSFHANDSLFLENEPVQLTFNYTLNYDELLDALFFNLGVIYHYNEQPEENGLAKIEVENQFYIQNLAGKIDKGQLILPDSLWITIVSLSVTHTRALAALYLNTSKLRDTLIPIINPVEVASTFFPNIKANLQKTDKAGSKKQK